MALYRFSPPPFQLTRAVNGVANTPAGIRNEGDVPHTAELLRLGVRNESRVDMRFADAGEIMTTSEGDVIAVRGSTGGLVYLMDVGNGSQNLRVIGANVPVAAYQAAIQPTSETQATVNGAVVETAVLTKIPLPGVGVQAADEPELQDGPGEGGGLDPSLTPGPGAAGAAEAATYSDGTTDTVTTDPYAAPPPPPYEPPAPVYADAPVYVEPHITPPNTGDGGILNDPNYGPHNDGTFY